MGCATISDDISQVQSQQIQSASMKSLGGKVKSLFSSTPVDVKNQTKQQLKKRLTSIQYQVTQLNGTEPPFKNEYNETKTPGTYSCVVCTRPLFTSENKYDNGCGWPAFYDELKEANITKKNDHSHGMVRQEVRCSDCDSHLGHIFNDGPQDKTGIRYCVNSASLKFNKEK